MVDVVSGLIVFAVLLVISTILAGVGILMEKHSFNKGVCNDCGEPLKLFDYDSHGGRGYKCPICRKHIWVSYNVVDKAYDPFRSGEVEEDDG
jgi:DNA-directed RNA polymerase subunit RPC12/RpoP